MRVLHIIGTLNPESGGPAASLVTLNKFRPEDTTLEVVTLDDPSSSFLQNFDFPLTAFGPTSTKYGWTPKLIPWLKANADRFDGIIVHGLWQYCGFAAWRVFKNRKPYMVFTHGMLDPYFKHAFPLKHIKKWAYWIVGEYWVLRSAYRVLFTCVAEGSLAKQSFWLHSWRSQVVSYGANLPSGSNESRRAAFLEHFPHLANKRFLLFLGRIDRKKGCDLLIDAFIQAATLDPKLDIVMAGPDEKNWRSGLDQSLSRANLSLRVHWVGMLIGEEKWGAFLASEAFILPSHQENFGIAVAEAMACGKPVLLSNKVNIAPDIAAANAGLMESDTLPGTYNLIKRWIDMSPNDRLTMSEAARRLFEKNYDMRDNARLIINLLKYPLCPKTALGSSTRSSS